MLTIRDTWGFSSIAPIILSGGFSVETLTGVTPSLKTKSNRSISAIEDGIPKWLQHCYKTYYEKNGYCERQACIIGR